MNVIIDGIEYVIEEIPGCHPEVASQAFWIRRDGVMKGYQVRRIGQLVDCDCPDFIFRRQWSQTGCKHVRALQELRLFEENHGIQEEAQAAR